MFQKKSKDEYNEQLMEIRIMIRRLKKNSQKSRNKQKMYYNQTREATFNGEVERAVIPAQQSIQHKHLSLRYLKLAMRMDFVEAMASSAVHTGMATEGVALLLRNVCAEPQAVITKLASFEKMFDDLSIGQDSIQNTFDQTVGLTDCEQNQEITDMMNVFNEELAMEQDVMLPSTGTPHASEAIKTKGKSIRN